MRSSPGITVGAPGGGIAPKGRTTGLVREAGGTGMLGGGVGRVLTGATGARAACGALNEGRGCWNVRPF